MGSRRETFQQARINNALQGQIELEILPRLIARISISIISNTIAITIILLIWIIGQGIIGVTFALGGNVDKPVFQMNPVSAVAPGILRKFFEYGNSGAPPPPRNRNADSN